MCGIAMYVGNKPANIDKMKILGIYNITRGEDACGIVINNKVSKGINDYQKGIKTANFSNFIEKIDLETSEEDSNFTCIVHNRKASTSFNDRSNPDHAHPFEIKDESGQVVMIGAHNGTIRNCEQLKKDFGMVGTFDVDSQLILSILAKNRKSKKPFEVLEKYEGKAVLTWFYLDEPNILYVWKGGSKEYTASKEITEERPMFVYQKEELNQHYFCSIKEALYAIGGNDSNVYSLDLNKVYKFIPTKKTRIVNVNREQVENFTTGSYQKTTCATTDINPSSSSNTSSSNSSSFSSLSTKRLLTSSKEISDMLEKTFVNYPSYKKSLKEAGRKGLKINSFRSALIDYEPFTFNPAKYKNKVYFFRGRYWQNGRIIGDSTKYVTSLILDINGYEKGSKKVKVDETTLDTYYFYLGFLLTGKKAADDLQKVLTDKREDILFKEDGKNSQVLTAKLCKYIYGFCINYNDSNGGARFLDNTNTVVYASGEFYPMFDYTKSYTFNYGTFVKANYNFDSEVTKDEILGECLTRNGALAKQKIIPLYTTTKDNIQKPLETPEISEDDNITQEVIDAGLDFVKDAENITNNFPETSINDSEVQKVLRIIKNSSEIIKKKLETLSNKKEEEEEIEEVPVRGLLYS